MTIFAEDVLSKEEIDMSKQTPGPWKIEKRHEDQDVLQIPIVDVHGACIAWCVKRTPVETFGSDDANACLIAAAPEMLEALMSASNQLTSDGNHPALVIMIDRLIAKATGR